MDLIANVSECNFLHPTLFWRNFSLFELYKWNTTHNTAEESFSSSENASPFRKKKSVESNSVALKKKKRNVKLLLSTTGSARVGGSVIFQCWRGRRRLTELLSDSSSSSSLSGLLRSFPPGMCGMDDKQRSQGIPRCERQLGGCRLSVEHVCVSGNVSIRAFCWR